MFGWFKKEDESYEARLPETIESDERFDPYSSTWLFLKNKLERDLLEAREQNDLPKDETATARLRGKIKYIKELLKLPEGTK